MKRMLIIDDEPDICDCLEQFFRSRGFTVISVFSGEEALDRLSEAPADVVLLDIILPGIHGLEVLKRIKELYPQAKVIVVTAYDHPELRVEAQTHGACGFVTKPFDFSEATWAPVFSS